MYQSTRTVQFSLGQTVITPGALESLNPDDINAALRRHERGDWGAISEDDWAENEISLENGFRLLSTYRDRKGTIFWIISEGDRSATTVLLPEEY